MKFVIRTDSSSTIGSGHLMRCLTLADGLRRAGDNITFVTRRLPGNLCHLIEEAGYGRHILTGPNPGEAFDKIADLRQTLEFLGKETLVDWMIVDHYALDEEWERPMRDYAGHIMVIDDLADRKHDCDILLDQNLFPDSDVRYKNCLSESCRQLLGPQYALLRPEFAATRSHLRKRDGSINRLLISMGGTDPHNLTSLTLAAAEALDIDRLTVDVVIGAANPHVDEIEKIARRLASCTVYHPARDMAALMAGADLCIGTSGSTTWERCCLGLPTLIIAAADTETDIARSADAAGIGKYLGRFDEIGPDMIADELTRLNSRPEVLRSWSEKAAALVDGRGVERVCRAITQFVTAEVRQ